jgi:glucose/arabinose dehydrogenase
VVNDKRCTRGSRVRAIGRLSVVLVLTIAGVLGLANVALPQTGVMFEELASGFSAPVDIAATPDGLLYVVEQAGRIKILSAEGTVSGTLLDISDRVLNAGEQGLLGLAFPSDYATSGRFYVYYTRLDGNNQLSSFLRPGAGQVSPPAETPILTIAHPTFDNHNGGDLNFGPDGYLYVATGDGGSANDPNNNAQNRASLLGKILRLDVGRDDFPTDSTRNYGIPPTNPFASGDGADEIWAMGLRNPWRFSFDSLTGHMYIGDVGQGQREEIDFQRASSGGGANYGWRCFEGTRPTGISKCAKSPAYAAPVAEYDHATGACAVTGGYVYRGSRYPALQGDYLYIDFCSGELFSLDAATATGAPGPARSLGVFSGLNISSFGQGADGELYAADLGSGKIYRLQATKGPKPT